MRNTTEAINLVADSWGLTNLGPGDVVVLSEMEHHSNLVPWQFVAARARRDAGVHARRRRGPPGAGRPGQARWRAATGELVATCHVSNMLGTINPVAEIICARARGRRAGAAGRRAERARIWQSIVPALGVDFWPSPATRCCGPMGTGVLYGRRELLEAMPPFLGGGDMIRRRDRCEAPPGPTCRRSSRPARRAWRTRSVSASPSTTSARIGLDAIRAHEQMLTGYALERLAQLPG